MDDAKLLQIETKTGCNGRLQLLLPKLENKTQAPAAVEGVRVPMGQIQPQNGRVLAFRSEWGREFSPQWSLLGEKECCFGSYQGRCSHGYSPFLYFFEADGSVACASVCWSGNWQMEISRQGQVDLVLLPEMLSCTLQPGQSLPLPALLFARHEAGLEALCATVAPWLEQNWFGECRVPQGTVEWNHWWTYEDVEVNEQNFLHNAAQAKELGATLCTLDAGWFGDENEPAHWTQCRGDWALVNRQRFPHGLQWLARQVHGLGLQFGIWLEPEGLGACSRLMREHPKWAPLRDGVWEKEPYLCLAAEGAAEWLFQTLDGIVEQTGCDWIKLDFNVDPGFGCNRADHGHEPGLGLYRHYQNYYAVLDRLREKYPHLVLENCSSGGLRLDLEMLRHTDVSFLSDPDEAPHSLQCAWAASMLIPPKRLLHWAPSQTRLYPDGSRVFPNFEIDHKTSELALRAALRCAMLHHLGLSRDLTALPPRASEIFKQELALYKQKISPLLYEACLIRLTPQPLRTGERTDDERRLAHAPAKHQSGGPVAFALAAPGRGVLFAFDLQNEGGIKIFTLTGLAPGAAYEAQDADTLRKWRFMADQQGAAAFALPLQPGACSLTFYHQDTKENIKGKFV